jgi:hypothetical protein
VPLDIDGIGITIDTKNLTDKIFNPSDFSKHVFYTNCVGDLVRKLQFYNVRGLEIELKGETNYYHIVIKKEPKMSDVYKITYLELQNWENELDEFGFELDSIEEDGISFKCKENLPVKNLTELFHEFVKSYYTCKLGKISKVGTDKFIVHGLQSHSINFKVKKA